MRFALVLLSNFLTILLSYETLFAAGTMYAFIGADTSSSLKYSCEIDFDNVKKSVHIVAKQTEMKLLLTTCSGRSFMPDKLVSWLKTIKPKSEDVVFFYFSGHGKVSCNKWPMLYFTKKKVPFLFSEIIKHIRRKNARLSIILCDACNGQRIHHSLSTYSREQQIKTQSKGLKKLFCKLKGVIIGSAAKSGQQAFSTLEGGVFTKAFLSELERETLKRKPNWKHLFKKIFSRCSGVQKPQTQMKLK